MPKAPLVSFSWGDETFFNSGSIDLVLIDGQGDTANVSFDFTDIPRGVAIALLVPAVQKIRDTGPRGDDDEPGLAGVTIYLDLNGNGQLNPLNGPWTLTTEITTKDGTFLSDSFVFDDPKIPEVRSTFNEIIFDDTKGNENHEHGGVDRFVFGFEKTVGDPGDIVNADISHQNDGGGILNHQTITITNSTLSGNVANNTSVAMGEDGRIFVDHNHLHNVTPHVDVETPGIGNTTHDFANDFFV